MEETIPEGIELLTAAARPVLERWFETEVLKTTLATDAVIGAFRNFELNQMDIDGRPGRAFYPEDHGVPAYEELILVTHPDFAGTDKLERFLTVLDQATRLIINEPETSYRYFVSFRPDDLDNELNRRAWRDTLPKLARETRQTDPNSWDQFAHFMKDRGLIDSIPDQKTYLFP